DAPYYAKVGFGPVPPGRLTMPGPVDPSRLLFRELDLGSFAHAKGPITKPQNGAAKASCPFVIASKAKQSRAAHPARVASRLLQFFCMAAMRAGTLCRNIAV